MVGRKPNGKNKKIIFNAIAESYPFGLRYGDLEKLVSDQPRPNINYLINMLIKEKKIVREKPIKSAKAVYYRLVV